METIGPDDFTRVELRVGRIASARVFAEARKPACVPEVDFGVRDSRRAIHGPHQQGVFQHLAGGNMALCVPAKPVPVGAKPG